MRYIDKKDKKQLNKPFSKSINRVIFNSCKEKKLLLPRQEICANLIKLSPNNAKCL